MINSIGLQNIGVEAFLRESSGPAGIGTPYIVNVFGYATEDYVSDPALGFCGRTGGVRVERLLPEYETWRHFFGSDPGLLSELVTAVR